MTQVAAAIIFREGRVLLGRRGPGGNCGGLWEFPGGKLEPGETPEQCLVRECQEEIALTVQPLELISRVVHHFPDQPIELFFYTAQAGEGEPQALVHKELRWVEPESLGEYAFSPANREVLDIVKSRAFHENLLYKFNKKGRV